MSEDNIENITKSESNFDATFKHRMQNLNTYFRLGNCLFGSVKLTKNLDLDKYKYTSYSTAFDSPSKFLFTDGNYGKNVIIFGADMSSWMHVDNKGKDILVLVEGPTQGLDDTTLTAEAEHPINFAQSGKYLCSVYTKMKASTNDILDIHV